MGGRSQNEGQLRARRVVTGGSACSCGFCCAPSSLCSCPLLPPPVAPAFLPKPRPWPPSQGTWSGLWVRPPGASRGRCLHPLWRGGMERRACQGQIWALGARICRRGGRRCCRPPLSPLPGPDGFQPGAALPKLGPVWSPGRDGRCSRNSPAPAAGARSEPPVPPLPWCLLGAPGPGLVALSAGSGGSPAGEPAPAEVILSA